MYEDEDLIPLSALQHFQFCERQCALIHVEQLWAENSYTAEGRILHERAHSEKGLRRPGRKTEFGMPIRSLALGLIGRTDAVEYREDGGIVIVEYKRGRPKKGREDEVQLCAQALCLEEMRGASIAEGALYYGKTKRRKVVALDEELRSLTEEVTRRVHALVDSGKTPEAPFDEGKCPNCSLLGLCMPGRRTKGRGVEAYLRRMLREGDG